VAFFLLPDANTEYLIFLKCQYVTDGPIFHGKMSYLLVWSDLNKDLNDYLSKGCFYSQEDWGPKRKVGMDQFHGST